MQLDIRNGIRKILCDKHTFGLEWRNGDSPMELQPGKVKNLVSTSSVSDPDPVISRNSSPDPGIAQARIQANLKHVESVIVYQDSTYFFQILVASTH